MPPGAYGLIEPLAAEIDVKRERVAATGGMRFGPRSGHWYGPEPRTGQQALALRDRRSR